MQKEHAHHAKVFLPTYLWIEGQTPAPEGAEYEPLRSVSYHALAEPYRGTQSEVRFFNSVYAPGRDMSR